MGVVCLAATTRRKVSLSAGNEKTHFEFVRFREYG